MTSGFESSQTPLSNHINVLIRSKVTGELLMGFIYQLLNHKNVISYYKFFRKTTGMFKAPEIVVQHSKLFLYCFIWLFSYY